MLILDIDHSREKITGTIIGKSSEFYRDLDRIKAIPNATYDPEEKVWLIERKRKYLNMLKSRFDTAMLVDEYELLGEKQPSLPTPFTLIEEADDSIEAKIADLGLRDLKTELFDFQLLGAVSAAELLDRVGGFIIADTMGLGKTAQAIAVASSFIRRDTVDTILVTCPKNVKFQWHHEIGKFSDLSSVVVDGYDKATRLECFEEEADLYIINHDQLIIEEDFQAITRLSPEMIIADEIHYFKNHDIKRTKALKKLGRKTAYRLGLTGTPMQNNPSDLHSIFEFLIPDLFATWKDFKKKYIIYTFDQGYMREAGYKNLIELKKTIGPYMIRRIIDDVKNEMPEFKKKNHPVPMTEAQIALHRYIEQYISEKRDEESELKAISQSLLGEVAGDDELQNKLEKNEGLVMGLMGIQMEISDDLRLLSMSESGFVRSLVDDIDLKRSNKLKYVLRLLRSILDYNERFKVVIFSQFARMVQLLKREIETTGLSKGVSIICGDLSERRRDREIQEFKNNPKRRIIVMSDAGATGLNLEVASHLINYDLPWNPATLNQRNGRIRRIGSPWKTVYISNIISRGSIDETIIRTLQKKENIFEKIVENSDEQKKLLREFCRQIS